MQNAVKNALKLQFLERPLQDAIAQLQKDMGFDEKGGGSFDGLTPGEQQRFKDAVANIGGNFAEAMKMYEDLFKEIDDADPTTKFIRSYKRRGQPRKYRFISRGKQTPYRVKPSKVLK